MSRVRTPFQAQADAATFAYLFSEFVFHDRGVPVGDIRKSWAASCKAAGAPGLRFHDLRRSGIRNMTRSGVPPSVAMSISGHRTISTFLRYDIASEEDKREALRKVEARRGR
jgi:integrase